ncbi:MAG: hypothetical protein CVV33_10495, partial [Methanomicrobiales archaeon HGW-Methanomicrobiales-4]
LTWKRCGEGSYNTATQSCCLGKVYEGKNLDLKACGKDGCYDTRNQTCTRGKIGEKALNDTSNLMYWK